MNKRCFVVMGFGVKTDLATGRKLNLDKSYNALIKPVIVAKGLDCVRADEIRHAGSIDLPMYQELLTADVVIADLSTANPNAFYELGLRHGLRPRTTIIISEQELSYPFDLNHIQINKYTHLGDNIDYFEVLRFQKLLGDTLDVVLNPDEPDSPIYTFLNNLIPPSLQQEATRVARQVNQAMKAGDSAKANPENISLSFVVKQAEAAMDMKQYSLAKSLFKSAILMLKSSDETKTPATDSYLIHRCAYAAYKAREPDELSALKESTQILSELDLAHTNDAETVILAGKIEKRLYFNQQDNEHLANAILYFERGFFLLNNRYNGINLAFLLNLRADSNLYTTKEDKIADVVFANRIRRMVLARCATDWDKLNNKIIPAEIETLTLDSQLAANQTAIEQNERFWILVNKAEAHFGLGEMDEYKQARSQAGDTAHKPYMMTTFTGQLETLRQLLRRQGSLLNPAWKEE